MNIYVVLRAILHALLLAANSLALMAAAWNAAASTRDHLGVSPGEVLVVVGTVAYAVTMILTWAECCIPRALTSCVRTELALVPMVIVLQLGEFGAAVVTAETIASMCRDALSCISLNILAWVAPVCLIAYYLIILAVVLDHAKTNPEVWDASPLGHPWFLRPAQSPPKSPEPMHKNALSLDISLPVTVAAAANPERAAAWAPVSSSIGPWSPPPDAVPPGATLRTLQRTSVQSTHGSIHSLFVPRWARELPPLRRGVELPFPVRPSRAHSATGRWADSSWRIDVPVSVSVHSERI